MLNLRGLFGRRSGLRPEKPMRRSSLERLEDRIAPANLTVTISGHTLTIVGDADPNAVTITGDMADLTKFIVSTTGGTINGAGTSLTTESGITDISIKLLDGADTVTFAASPAVNVQKSLTIDGGSGGNTITSTNLTVGKNLSITNAAGTDSTSLSNLSVGGNVTVKNGDGDSSLVIRRGSAGGSSINGNLSVTNGTGADTFYLNDTNVGGSLTVKNGHGSAGGAAGVTGIYNNYNALQSIIRGNVSVSYLDGNGGGADSLDDTEVGGNVSFAFGKGNFTIYLDGAATSLPTLVDGNLALKSAGQLTVFIGSATQRGLTVLKNLSITTGGAAEDIRLFHLQVAGSTKLALGDGANVTSIDDSLFTGKFNITTGKDADTVNIETLTGTNLPTIFQNTVTGNLGVGDEAFTFGGASDAGQFLVLWRDAVFHTGQGMSTSTTFNGHISLPFGSRLDVIQ